MTISKLATEVWPLAKTAAGHNRFYRRPTAPQGFIVHHAATTADAALKAAYVSRARELSSNYAMRGDGTVVAVLHEEYRPFTSASPKADNWGITIEIVNSTGAAGGWQISARAFDNLARLIADCAKRWGWTISRQTVIGHREVVGRFGQGYATACPGGIWPRMDELVALARKYAGQGQQSKPAPTKPSTPAPAAGGTYTVQRGDTLSLIGRRAGVPWRDIAALNGIGGAYVIRVGQKLRMPAKGSAPKPAAPAKPAAPKPTAGVIGKAMRLATPWTVYRTAALAKAKGRQGGRIGSMGAGTFTVIGTSAGQYKIRDGRGRTGWINELAKSGIR